MRAQVHFWLMRHPLLAPVGVLLAVGGGAVRLAPAEWWSLHATLLGVGLSIVLAIHFQYKAGGWKVGLGLQALNTGLSEIKDIDSRFKKLESLPTIARELRERQNRED